MTMETIVSGRHFEVDGSLREYAVAKFNRFEEEYGKLTSARLVVSEERGRCIAEGHILGKNMTLNASGRTDAPQTSIDVVFEKLERQLRKRLERIQEHRGPSLSQAEIEEVEAEEPAPEDEDTEVAFTENVGA
ncbi:MAG: ribosome-associated translation inhibitor RaiA [Lentisphaeria bacterium]|nr:ribosome-associated translation inhibitor RaiA [Lentisphaeria bacterium]